MLIRRLYTRTEAVGEHSYGETGSISRREEQEDSIDPAELGHAEEFCKDLKSRLSDTWEQSHPPNYGNLRVTLYMQKEARLSILASKRPQLREKLDQCIGEMAPNTMGHFVPGCPWPPSAWTTDIKKCIELTKWLAASFIFAKRISLQKHIFRYIWGFSRDEDFSLLKSSSAASGTQTLSSVSRPEISSNQSR